MPLIEPKICFIIADFNRTGFWSWLRFTMTDIWTYQSEDVSMMMAVAVMIIMMIVVVALVVAAVMVFVVLIIMLMITML